MGHYKGRDNRKRRARRRRREEARRTRDEIGSEPGRWLPALDPAAGP